MSCKVLDKQANITMCTVFSTELRGLNVSHIFLRERPYRKINFLLIVLYETCLCNLIPYVLRLVIAKAN